MRERRVIRIDLDLAISVREYQPIGAPSIGIEVGITTPKQSVNTDLKLVYSLEAPVLKGQVVDAVSLQILEEQVRGPLEARRFDRRRRAAQSEPKKARSHVPIEEVVLELVFVAAEAFASSRAIRHMPYASSTARIDRKSVV